MFGGKKKVEVCQKWDIMEITDTSGEEDHSI
jgi:hypothetical protein